MIGRLSGILLEKHAPNLLIDVQGVGYEVQAPMSTFYQLPELGKEVVLHIHFVVREDAQLLFGFYNHAERSLFRILIKVNGVGPKLALVILSGIGIDDFVTTVRAGDTATLVRLPGVGKKTAERLIIEMRDRLKDWQLGSSDESESDDMMIKLDARGDLSLGTAIGEAESALIALGYKPTEASKAVNAALSKAEGQSSEELIRLSLKGMITA